MKNYLFLFLNVLIICNSKLAYSQCESCNIALAKDHFNSNQTIDSRLALLSMVNQDNYEQVKNDHSFAWESSGKYAEIFSGTFNGSDDYHTFEEKRNKLFKLFSYESSSTSVDQEERSVTNPISYKYWSACIAQCYEHQDSRAYGYISSADSNQIDLNVKYFSSPSGGPVPRNSIKLQVEVLNGKIFEKILGSVNIYSRTQTFTLSKNLSRYFQILRDPGQKSCTIKVTSTKDGSDVFHTTVAFEHPAVDNYADISYTINDQKDSFLRRESTVLTSPNTAPASPYTNYLYLTTLPINQFYGNFSNLECMGEHPDACQFNQGQGLSPTVIKSTDQRSASITFITYSLPCVYVWAADVFEKIGSIYSFKDKMPITGKHFTLRIPHNATDASIEVTAGKETFLLVPGQDDANKNVTFLQKGSDGTFDVYAYVFNK